LNFNISERYYLPSNKQIYHK